MTQNEIEHMWKVASNNPNHDTNWHDPVIVTFAKMVAAHTLMKIDPSSFMSHQEGIEVGRLAERAACLADVKKVFATFDMLPESAEKKMLNSVTSIFIESIEAEIELRARS